MVTHEADIAAHANRIIRFHDGKVLDDRKIATPRDTALEPVDMPPVDDATQVVAESREAAPVLSGAKNGVSESHRSVEIRISPIKKNVTSSLSPSYTPSIFF